MTGNWIFFVTSQKFVGGSDRGTGALVQSGNGVTGTLNFTGGCLNTAPLSGTLQQSALTFQLTENGQPASFTGTVDPRFSSASGSWTTVQGGCGDGDFGIWNAIKRLTPD
jgi:hypothetical protein